MFRHLAVATVAAAALAGGTQTAQAACLPGVNEPLVGATVCASLVHNCIDANVYYRVLGVSGNTESLYPPVCPL